jgi:ubiquinone/menaquinone biosynthesis C-methylase UbiE
MHDHHFNEEMVSRLENESRMQELRPSDLLGNIARIHSGMTCVDLGCGTGIFTIPMTEIVGRNGKVYGVDDKSAMLEYIRNKRPPDNLILLEKDVRDTGLDDGIADFCLLAFILHEVKDPGALIAEAYRLLKPGGKIMVLEWRPDGGPKGPPVNIRLTESSLKKIFDNFKFKDFEYRVWSVNHYLATAIK